LALCRNDFEGVMTHQTQPHQQVDGTYSTQNWCISLKFKLRLVALFYIRVAMETAGFGVLEAVLGDFL
jgi:hypothetical protein